MSHTRGEPIRFWRHLAEYEGGLLPSAVAARTTVRLHIP